MVPDLLVGKPRGRDDFHCVKGCPRHIHAVEGTEVGELLESSSFGGQVGGLDLAPDFVEGFGNEDGFADELQAEPLDEVLDGALEEGFHERS